MPAKKNSKKTSTAKKSTLSVSKKQTSKLAADGMKEMKKRGFKTPEEYIAYIDKKRGY